MADPVVVEFDPDDHLEVTIALATVRGYFRGQEDWEITLPTGEKVRLGNFPAGVLEDCGRHTEITDLSTGKAIMRPMEHYEVFDTPLRTEQLARLLLAKAAEIVGAPAVAAGLTYEQVQGAFKVIALDTPEPVEVPDASGVDPTGSDPSTTGS